MAQLVVAVTVAVAASLPLVEDKMPLPPTLAYHTSADTNNKLLICPDRAALTDVKLFVVYAS